MGANQFWCFVPEVGVVVIICMSSLDKIIAHKVTKTITYIYNYRMAAGIFNEVGSLLTEPEQSAV